MEAVKLVISSMLYVIMPNHFHGIVFITGDGMDESQCIDGMDESECICGGRGVLQYAPTTMHPNAPTTVTKQINIMRKLPGIPVWQRNYYEHIIRDDNRIIG